VDWLDVNRLSASTLPQISGADVPSYDRSTEPSIVHLGVGAFARAHLAVYADELLGRGIPAAIAGVSLRSRRAEEQLAPQDGLFTVTEREPDIAPRTRVVGSLTSVATGTHAAIAAVAAPATSFVSLTVTEKAYVLDGPDAVPAVLASALGDRRERGGSPLVVASLDNLLDNGTVLRDLVLRAADDVDAELGPWIAEHVRFPCSVVDRMVPATTSDDLHEVAAHIGLVDDAAIVAEAHRSWVLEDVPGLPPFGDVGAEVVADVAPYQQRKLWLLNGAHSALAYCGHFAGHRTIAEAAADPAIARFVRQLIDDVLTAVPADVPSARAFADESLRRCANPALGHACAQVGADGSRKLPQRLLPVRERLAAAGRSTERIDLVLAAWLTAVTGAAHADPVDDPATAEVGAALFHEGVGAAVHAAFGPGVDPDGIGRARERLVREGVGAFEEQT
jgi:fructuronate reductase